MFVRGGNVYPGRSLDRAGYGGYYWSSVGISSSRAYHLGFVPGGVGPSSNGPWYYGQSVRCVALGD